MNSSESELKSAHWACAITSSYGNAFLVHEKLVQQKALPLEIFPRGSQGYLLVEVPDEALVSVQKTFQEFSREIVNAKVIENLKPEVMKAYLSLELAKVQKFLLFFQVSFVGDAFQLAQTALQEGFSLVDFRMLRGKDEVTHMILTGEDIEKARSFKSKWAAQEPTLIENPSSSLSLYFDIIP